MTLLCNHVLDSPSEISLKRTVIAALLLSLHRESDPIKRKSLRTNLNELRKELRTLIVQQKELK